MTAGRGRAWVDVARWILTVIAGLSVALVGVLAIADAPGHMVAAVAGSLYALNGALWAAVFVTMLRLIRRGAAEGHPDAVRCARDFDNALLSDRGMALAVVLTWPIAMVRSGAMP